MSIQGSTIISNTRTILQDNGTTKRWSDAELLVWLNMAQDQIVAIKPDAGSVITSFKLAAGQTRQNLPDGSDTYKDPSNATQKAGIALLDITRNMGANGATPGGIVSIIDRVLLDQISPSWHTSTGVTEISHYMYSEKVPLIFFVTPKTHATTQVWVELIYVAKPTPLATTASYIDLPDEYASIIMDYVLFRAYSKSVDSNINFSKASMYYQAFTYALGGKIQAEAATDPNNLMSVPSVSIRRV